MKSWSLTPRYNIQVNISGPKKSYLLQTERDRNLFIVHAAGKITQNNDNGVISLKEELKSAPAIIARSGHRKVISK